MRFRNSRVRAKVTALLASLTALWAFAAWVTVQDGLDLLWANTLDKKISRPGVTMVTALQQERRLSMVYLGSSGRHERRALQEQRVRTDKAVADFRRLAGGDDVSRAASATLESRLADLFKDLDTLAATRAEINAQRVPRSAAAASFNSIIDSAFRVFNAAGASLDDEEIVKDSRTLNSLIRAKEILSREDAHLAGGLSAGRLTDNELAEFVQLAGAQRVMHGEAVAELPAADQARYERFRKSAEYQRFQTLEELMIQKGRAMTRPPIQAAEWKAAVEPTLQGLEKVVLEGGDDLLDRSAPVATAIIIRLVLAGGLGMLAVIASIVLSITTARALVHQLELLRSAAWELANKRLPSVVERLGHGENVDVSAEAPPLKFGNDVIGQVGRAFNAVQETAIRTAVEQAELRRGIRDVLLSLARRTQTLVHRQLTLLDTMERREVDPQELQDLFRLDHLATRMRRNAENLIVLSGATPARGWRRAVPMIDVVRAAVAEVEDYTRVTVLPIGPVSMAGRAVGDVTHLLAELIENALAFSPPYTTVQVGGQQVASGFAIEIEDRGLGMSDERLEELNERISDPPEFNLSSNVQLGLYVVGRLAQRYNVRVSLKRSPYGGTTAVALIPHELVVEDDESAEPTPASGTAPAATARGGQGGEDGGAGKVAVLEAPAPDKADSAGASVRLLVRRDDERPADDRPSSESDDAPESSSAEPPGSAMPENLPPAPETTHTPSGLPFRVPQANLVPQLRSDTPLTAEPDPEEADGGRSPEEIRRIVGAYQSGTRRGRSDAAKSLRADVPDPEASDEDDPQQS